MSTSNHQKSKWQQILLDRWQKNLLAHFYLVGIDEIDENLGDNYLFPRRLLERWVWNLMREVLIVEGKNLSPAEVKSKIIKGIFPDIVFLGFEEENFIVDKEYSLKDFDCLSTILNYPPWELRNQWLIISDAHLMSEVVTNKLLKIFEEPPPSLVVLLLRPLQTGLLPTLLSRAVSIVVSKEELSKEESNSFVDAAFGSEVGTVKIEAKRRGNSAFDAGIDPGMLFARYLKDYNDGEKRDLIYHLVALIKKDPGIYIKMLGWVLNRESENFSSYQKKHSFLGELSRIQDAIKYNGSAVEKVVSLVEML